MFPVTYIHIHTIIHIYKIIVVIIYVTIKYLIYVCIKICIYKKVEHIRILKHFKYTVQKSTVILFPK